jgi:flavin reductase (DIM6/NTAB) family NADH-FMN oxidoreductase RutF
MKFCTQCPSRYFALHVLPRNSVHNVAIVSDKKISRNESIAKEMRTVENSRANETAYHITNQEEDELFRLESCPCHLQTAVHNVFYLLEINVKK